MPVLIQVRVSWLVATSKLNCKGASAEGFHGEGGTDAGLTNILSGGLAAVYSLQVLVSGLVPILSCGRQLDRRCHSAAMFCWVLLGLLTNWRSACANSVMPSGTKHPAKPCHGCSNASVLTRLRARVFP